MEIINKPILNPWVSMWIKPRATIQQIIDTNPNHLVLILAALFGVSDYLFYGQFDSITKMLKGSEWQIDFVFFLIIGSIKGIAYLYIVGGLIYWLEKTFKNKVKATSNDIRAAIAWSHVPMIWGLIFWLPLFGIFMGIIADSKDFLIMFFLVNISVQIFLKIYTFVVFLKCLGQVLGISMWGVCLDLFLCSVIFELFSLVMLGLIVNTQ